MLHIILLILKIAGIVLGSIIGLVLLLLALILFVSIRYRGEAQFAEKLLYTLKVGWIPGVVSVTLSNAGGKNRVTARLFGITVYDSAKEKKASDAAAENEGEGNDAAAENEEEWADAAAENEEEWFDAVVGKEKESADITAGKGKEEKESAGQAAGSETAPEAEAGRDKIFGILSKKFGEFKDQVKKKLMDVSAWFKKIKQKKDKLWEILFSDSGRQTLLRIKIYVIKLLNHIRPRKLGGHVCLGMGDAYATARVLSILGVMYPVLSPQWEITPDFQNKVIEGDLSFKGRIRLATILVIALRVYFDKGIKGMISALKNL